MNQKHLLFCLTLFSLLPAYGTVNFVPQAGDFKSDQGKNKSYTFQADDFLYLSHSRSDQYYLDWFKQRKRPMENLFFQLDHNNFKPFRPHQDYQALFDDGICFYEECAFHHLFTGPQGSRLSYLLNNFNINASFYRFQDHLIPDKEDLGLFIKKFSATELESIIKAIKSYPPSLQNFEDREIHAMRITKKFEDRISIANARMMYFDLWSKSEPWFQTYASIHELAHRIGLYYQVDSSESWKKVAEPDYSNFKQGKLHCVTKYIDSYLRDPQVPLKRILSEDFAEAVVLYQSKPHFMRTRCALKYNFLKETIFQGFEYAHTKLDRPVFNPSKQKFESLQRKIKSSMQRWVKTLTIDSFAKNHSTCKGISLKDSNLDQYIKEYISCWGKNNYKTVVEAEINQGRFFYPTILKQIYLKDYEVKLSLERLLPANVIERKVSQIKISLGHKLRQSAREILKQKSEYMRLYIKKSQEKFCYQFWTGDPNGSYLIRNFTFTVFQNYDWGFTSGNQPELFKQYEEKLCSDYYQYSKQNKKISPQMINHIVNYSIPEQLQSLFM